MHPVSILLAFRFFSNALSILQESYPAVTRKNIKHSSEQRKGRYLRVLMLSVVHVLGLGILG